MGKKLPKRLRQDSRDLAAPEQKLMRVCHQIWRMLKKARKSQTVTEIRALTEAVEQVWELKRQLRKELATQRRVQSARTRSYFRSVALKKRQSREQASLPFAGADQAEINRPS